MKPPHTPDSIGPPPGKRDNSLNKSTPAQRRAAIARNTKKYAKGDLPEFMYR